jgi:hypothetical protein
VVFLNTRKRSAGTPNNAFFVLDAGLHCGKNPGDRMTVTPLFVSMRRDWSIVSDRNRAFTLMVDGVGFEFRMPEGSGYNVISFGSTLQRILRLVVPNFTVIYDRITNKYTFVPPDDKAYRFEKLHPQMATFLGLDPRKTTSVDFKLSSPLVSYVNVSLAQQVGIVISTDLATANFLSTFEHEYVANTGILVVVPINVQPYAEISYQASTPDTGTLLVLQHHVHSIIVRVTDESGEPVDVRDYVIGMRFDIYQG